ncbi:MULTISPECIES: branched-chain amino acid ABC transporter permease [unclassified Arthrobacter]|uniref:branched-chain amino acid ABC transporter permease n=1 Tax=unclassified Arthrobacter TaxID=235627 RepID=UPI001E5587B3|nr:MULTISPECIES: branched-chain amino acid ABC transporter permease [unclassified Arthrobacter]MCC9146081.1 branched-chain amino acid ABC transporter permease [Arthrobacter sp. zg-Y919]MDK1277310.1 branched-chain amino acid ABC transporter permease [Arthrobacter sp. zg.Y919]WIB04493.1 branched-chain amino acid ABC transporter permease [Arthrobacter sp. zg-Y919]
MLAAVAAMFAALLLAAPAASATTATPDATSSATSPGPTDGSEYRDRISGVVKNEGTPLEGVKITATGNGYEGEAETGANGSWSIGVPEQGAYEVELDESTLPDDVALAEGQQNPRTVTFAGTSNITTLFLLGEGIVVQQESLASAITERAVAGLSFGLLLALSAVGLSLIFGTTGLTNFAHGEMVTMGAVLTFGFAALGMPTWVAIPLAVVGGAAFGYVQDAGLWKPLRRRGTGLIPMMIISIGLAVSVRYTVLFFLGGGTQQLPGAQSPTLELGPVSIPQNTLISLVVSLAVILVVALLLLRTRIGKATRAVSDNPALAAASGIDVDRVIRLVWVVGGALAALGGILWAYYRPGVSFNMGQQILLLIFAGVTLGGLGTVFGALIGSVIVGLFVEISTLWLEADLKYVGALVIMILVLLVRPQGILGRRERIG